jgi:hypothetical protein
VRPMEEVRLDSVDQEADVAVADWKLALILAGDAAVDKPFARVSLLGAVYVAIVAAVAVDYMDLVLLLVVDIAAVGGVVVEAVVDIPFAPVLFGAAVDYYALMLSGTAVVVDVVVAAAGKRSTSMLAAAAVAAKAAVVYSRHASFHAAVVDAAAAAVEVYVVADVLLELDLTGHTPVAGSHLVVVAVVGIAAAESVL